VQVLGVTVMISVLGASAYFVSVMVTEITKYVLLFQDVSRWTSGSDDDLGARGAAHKDMRRRKGGLMHKVELWLKQRLLKDMYATAPGGGGGKKKKSSSSGMAVIGGSSSSSSNSSSGPKARSDSGALASTENPMHVHVPAPPASRKMSSNIGLGDVFSSNSSGSSSQDTFTSGANPYYGSSRNVLAPVHRRLNSSAAPQAGADAAAVDPSSRLRSRSRSFGSMDSFVDDLLNATSSASSVSRTNQGAKRASFVPSAAASKRASLSSPSDASSMEQMFASKPKKQEQRRKL
jgi:hypothetical protein